MSKIIEITENVNEITKIAEVSQAALSKKGIDINVVTAIPTIGCVFLRAGAKYLSDNKSTEATTAVNLFDLLTLGISYEEIEDGEKDGNYTPFTEVGKAFTVDAPEESTFETSNEIEYISEKAKTILANEFGITISNVKAIPIITQTFLEQVIAYLTDNKAEGSEVIINLFHLIELGVTHDEDENKYEPFAVPGQEFKLLAKSDDNTED